MTATFTKRYTRPNASNLEYVTTKKGGWSRCIQGKPLDSACDVYSNCVGHACARFNEIYNEIMDTTGMKYYALNCNAENFIERAKEYYPELQFSDYPQEGAIIVWQKGEVGKGDDGAGHVAVVEDVIDDETIKTSESAYGGTAFYVSTRKKGDGNWGLNGTYKFRKFILNPAVFLVKPVERDTLVDQIKVITTVLRMRRTPDDTIKSNIWGTFCPTGIFNVIEKKKVEGKSWGDTWYRIEDNVWIAGVEETEFLPKKKDEVEELRRENAELKARLEDIGKAGGWIHG